MTGKIIIKAIYLFLILIFSSPTEASCTCGGCEISVPDAPLRITSESRPQKE